MPWITIPFKDPRIAKLSDRFEVEGIPSFVILDAAGNIVNKSARGGVESDPSGERFPYYPEPVEDLSQGAESFGFDVNSKPSLIALMENSADDEQADAKAALGKLRYALIYTIFIFPLSLE
jgi:nucleoredoxin